MQNSLYNIQADINNANVTSEKQIWFQNNKIEP